MSETRSSRVKNQKLLLIMFAPYRTVQMQIAALSAFLKSHGCQVRYLELIIFSEGSFEKYRDSIQQEVSNFEPDMVGFSSYDMNHTFIHAGSDYIKKIRPQTKIIVGGHSATLAPDDYMQNACIDYVCVGEGEYVLLDLLAALGNGRGVASIPGLCSRSPSGEIIYNSARDLVEELDELPFIDRSIVTGQHAELDYLPVLAGKGCPYRCSYCSNESMRELYRNKARYVRFRSPEKIIEEIEECRKTYSFKHVFFYDDIFALNADWLERFTRLYRRHFNNLPFHCLLNPSMAIHEDRLRLLKDAGCEMICMGVESGSQRYRQHRLRRMMSNKVILTAAALIRKHGMRMNVFMMVGLPGETFLDMLKTLWLNLRMAPEGVQTAIYFPLKNTPLYGYCLEHNLIDNGRKKKIFIYSYDTCMNYGRFRRHAIILFKWLNSATPVLRHCQISLIGHFLRIQYRKWLKGTVDYK